MKAYSEARCPNGHEFMWRTGTPFICPVCKYPMYLSQGNNAERFPEELTARELEVVALIGEGLTNHEVADELVIRECTVENHLHSIFGKLGLKTRTQVARHASANGIKQQKRQE